LQKKKTFLVFCNFRTLGSKILVVAGIYRLAKDIIEPRKRFGKKEIDRIRKFRRRPKPRPRMLGKSFLGLRSFSSVSRLFVSAKPSNNNGRGVSSDFTVLKQRIKVRLSKVLWDIRKIERVWICRRVRKIKNTRLFKKKTLLFKGLSSLRKKYKNLFFEKRLNILFKKMLALRFCNVLKIPKICMGLKRKFLFLFFRPGFRLTRRKKKEFVLKTRFQSLKRLTLRVFQRVNTRWR